MPIDKDTGEWIDEGQQGYDDIQTPEFGDGTPTGLQTVSAPGAPSTAPAPAASTDYSQQIKDTYQKDFGRGPDQNEMSSDLANAQKYGWDTGPNGGVKATIDKRMGNTPNAGEHAPGPAGLFPSFPGSAGGANHYDDMWKQLSGLFNGGQPNQDIINRRMDVARDQLNRERNRTLKNNQALLADRGLVGSGPEATSYENMDERLGGATNDAYQSIYGDELQRADSRMMNALTLATGMTSDQARNYIDQFRAQTDHDLGFGQLALGNKNSDQGFTLGQGQLALNNFTANNQNNQFYASLKQAAEQGNIEAILKLLELQGINASQLRQGHV